MNIVPSAEELRMKLEAIGKMAFRRKYGAYQYAIPRSAAPVTGMRSSKRSTETTASGTSASWSGARS
jgi:hypothetical protein